MWDYSTFVRVFSQITHVYAKPSFSSIRLMKKLLLLSFVFCLSASAFAQNKMKFYEDTAKMKQEVLSRIPIGTDTATARQIMLNSKFDFVGNYINDTFLYGGNINFLFFMHDEGLIFCMNRWKTALVYENAKVTGVQVQFVIICL